MAAIRNLRRLAISAGGGVAILALALLPLRNAGGALIVQRGVGTPDAIIMLASHEWERLPAAADQARRYHDATVLITHPPVVTAYNCYRCDERVAWLESEGVARTRIHVLKGNITNTYTEAKAARAYLATPSAGSLLIVTSPYHTRRALETFETVFKGTSVRIGVLPAGRADPGNWWWSGYDRHYVLYEWAAGLKYRIDYGVPLRGD